MSVHPTFTADRLREVLGYDPDTGVFRWRVKSNHFIEVGDIAGSPTHKGYRLIGVDGRNYPAHCLAWLYVHGVWPGNQIDHRNGVPSDNRIANLREATNALNHQNKHQVPRNNTSGYLGVTFNKNAGRWMAAIKVNRRSHYLGLFDTPEAASTAYLVAKRELHPFWDAA